MKHEGFMVVNRSLGQKIYFYMLYYAIVSESSLKEAKTDMSSYQSSQDLTCSQLYMKEL